MGQNFNKNRNLDLLRKILSTPSTTGNEEQMALFILDFFRDLGIPIILDRVDNKRFNIIGLIKGETPIDSLLLVTPLDTYQDTRNFDITSNFLYGPFDVGQKVSLSAILSAIEELMTSNFVPSKNILFLGVVDTKNEHRGIYEFVRGEIFPEMALMIEPTNLRIKVGCGGKIVINLKVQQKSNGMLNYEYNAISTIMELIPGLFSSLKCSKDLQIIGSVSSKSVLSSIKGVFRPLNLKNECELTFELITIPGITKSEIREKVIQLAESKIPGDIFDIVLKFDSNLSFKPVVHRGLLPTLTHPDELIVKIVSEALERNNIPPKLFFSYTYSEMDFLVNDLGIPTVGLGVGGEFHSQKIPLNDYFNAINIYIDIIKSI